MKHKLEIAKRLFLEMSETILNYNQQNLRRPRTHTYKNLIIFENSLSIETNIIGYQNQGEAILIFIYSDNVISYSILIDCYATNNNDKITEILVSHNVSTLDFICWTHPDLDHSKGLKKIIEQFASDKTQIWIPEDVDYNEITCSKEVKELFKYLNNCLTSQEAEYNVYSTSDMKNMLCYNSVCFKHGINEYPLKITSYAPNSKLIRKQNCMDQFIKNDRSIFCTLELGDACIYLTGDIENSTINMLPIDQINPYCHICKIPHHGSETSTDFINILTQCDIACSTVYRIGKCSLPNKAVLGSYEENTTLLYCTGMQNISKEKYSYGILTITTDILNRTFSIRTEGNAEFIPFVSL